MEQPRRFEPGEVVYLATELLCGGRIHEIGTRAVVVRSAPTGVAIALGGEEISCQATSVAKRVPRTERIPAWVRLGSAVRPATA
jgi:hypothetical protein